MTADRLQELADRADIHDVLVHIMHSQDAHDWVRLASCFQRDAVYIHPKGRIEGVDAIVARSQAALGALDSSQHFLGSVLIEVDGDEATAVSFFQGQHVREAAPGGSLYTIGGTYSDRFRRVDGRWLVAVRQQTYSWKSGNPDVIVR